MKSILKIGSRANPDELFELSFSFRAARKINYSDMVGDWILYYRTRLARAASQKFNGVPGYFAVATVERIEETEDKNIYRAYVGCFTQFAKPVPFKWNGIYFEAGVTHIDGAMNGALIQSELRPVSDIDFLRIVTAGLNRYLEPALKPMEADGLAEDAKEIERVIVQELRSRTLRDSAFADQVFRPYAFRCLVTRSDIIDPIGRSDLNAAHIRPVSHGGPDSVRNGFPCISSVHRLFDLGWFTFTDDIEIVISDFARGHPALAPLNNGDRLLPPMADEYRPHPTFLKFHRDYIFEHWTKGRSQTPYQAPRPDQ